MEDFVKAIGAISEMTALFYLQLVKHEIPPIQAATLTSMIISKLLGGNKTDGQQENRSN